MQNLEHEQQYGTKNFSDFPHDAFLDYMSI